mmetsp:Transcript_5504/g.8511  ORF Transcript_5504/g.8511 Transcript_5504/m.8511 type:complete len:99 (+) Transcript_5504:52-348(+)
MITILIKWPCTQLQTRIPLEAYILGTDRAECVMAVALTVAFFSSLRTWAELTNSDGADARTLGCSGFMAVLTLLNPVFGEALLLRHCSINASFRGWRL